MHLENESNQEMEDFIHMMDKNLFKIPKIKPVLLGLAVIAILQALFIVGQAYFLAKGISHLWNGETLAAQWRWIILFFCCFFGRQLLLFFRDRGLSGYAHEQAVWLRKQLLEKIFQLGPNFVQKEGTANMVTMNIEGISQVENYISLILPKLTNMMVIPWLIALFMFFLDVRSAVIVLIVFPIIILFMIILGYAARAKADRQYEGFQRLGNHFLDVLRGLETLKLLGLSEEYEKNVYEVSEDYRKATMSTLKVAILSTFALDFFTTLSVAVVALFLGLELMEGSLLLFPALTVLILAPDFFLPLRDFANDYHATLNGGNTLKDIFRVLNNPSPQEEEGLHLKPWDAESSLVIKQLSASYQHEEAEPTLQDIQMDWQGFGKVGIVGLSGSGKSTLIKVLGGFLLPNEQSDILLDQHKVPHFHQESWQKQLFYIPQNPYLFHDTLANNIRFYVPDASNEAVRAAAEKAGLVQLIEELPAGLETLIGEGGQVLSGGQAQRVALARAFLDLERKILLFDEPTAHLDIETEDELKQTMLPLFDDHLVFFATHRLHWMKEMDYILVMKDGKIVQQGTYEELKQDETGAYAQLAREMGGDLS